MTENNAAAETTEAPATELESAMMADDEALGAAWDKLTADEAAEEAPEEPAETEEAPEDEPPAAEQDDQEDAGEDDEGEEEPAASEDVPPPPSDLPARIKEHWKDIPADAREAFVQSQREMSNRLAEQGRVVSAARPVYDVLVKAAQEIPTLNGMTPDAIARDVFQMAQVQGHLAQDPVNTLIKIAQDYGALDGIKGVLTGEQQPGAQDGIKQAQERREAMRKAQEAADPKRIEGIVEQQLAMRETQRAIQEFASAPERAAYWSEVESVLPSFIPAAKTVLGESASPGDVLAKAYDMAIHANDDLRAKVEAAAKKKAPARPDPERTEAQLKAKSVNVRSSGGGKPRQMTEEQRMAAVWDKHAS